MSVLPPLTLAQRASAAARRTEAEAFEVEADRFEAAGLVAQARAASREAAWRYDLVGRAFMYRDAAVAAEAFEASARSARRGKSHARAGTASGLAAWMRGHEKTGTNASPPGYREENNDRATLSALK